MLKIELRAATPLTCARRGEPASGLTVTGSPSGPRWFDVIGGMVIGLAAFVVGLAATLVLE